ncbi:MAG: pimeloyl-ACP methyl ester carboxylesterase, partial [Bacteroidia bacterium]
MTSTSTSTSAEVKPDSKATATSVPEWFTHSLSIKPTSHTIDVSGVPIHSLRWGDDPNKPGLVFVHGNGAHAYWWTFIAPFFLDHYRVIAIDLAGAGDSGASERYTPEAFAKQINAVADDAEFGSDTIIVGHSFGGYITLKTGLIYNQRLGGVVLVDSAVRPPDFQWERDPRSSPVKPKRVYADFDAALARFRLMPPQGCENQYILD